jgi:hypothetical protein
MLHCNMNTSLDIQLGLEDLLADLHFARRDDKLGRLALLAYCEVKGWARRAGKPYVADEALRMFSESPCLSKQEFLERVDNLIATLERHQNEYQRLSGGYSIRAAPVSKEIAAMTAAPHRREPAEPRWPNGRPDWKATRHHLAVLGGTD